MLLYLKEPGWREVAETVTALASPLPLFFLHEIEIVNVLHRLVFEKKLERQQRDAVIRLFHADIHDGLYRRIAVDVADLSRAAVELSDTWCEKIGIRSLDVLHVAAAQIVGANRFLTGDVRQRRLASAAGLKTS